MNAAKPKTLKQTAQVQPKQQVILVATIVLAARAILAKTKKLMSQIRATRKILVAVVVADAVRLRPKSRNHG
jgi:hypothetical protein